MAFSRRSATALARCFQVLAMLGFVLLCLRAFSSRAEEIEDTEPVIRLSW
jgi:hypothetical protein